MLRAIRRLRRRTIIGINMFKEKELSRQETQFGYSLVTVLNTPPKYMGGKPFKTTKAISNCGGYIGDEKVAKLICEDRGIIPERVSQNAGVCSIGFSKNDSKWYGWSHRAMHGFGIGSSVKRGDLAYSPVDEEDTKKYAVEFWDDENRSQTKASEGKRDEDGKLYFDISWTYSDNVPNKKIRSQIGCVRHYAPQKFGRGEWVAETLDDAKQMAIDFANNVG